MIPVGDSNGGKYMSIIYQVTVSKGQHLSRNNAVISRNIALNFGLESDSVITLLVGHLNCRVKLKINYTKTGHFLAVSPLVLNKLHLPGNSRYGLQMTASGLRIGPVIGIMGEYGSNSARPFGGQGLFFSQLSTAGRKLGELCFAFDPSSVNYVSKTVQGFIYSHGIWRKGVFPIPDVVYPRESGYSQTKKVVRNRLEAAGCRFINPSLIGKWQTNQSLSKDLSLSRYLPETRIVNNFDQIDKMLNQYGAVYLKPITGSQGRNIIRVAKAKNKKTYWYSYQRNSRPYRNLVHSLGALRLSLRPVMGSRRYIVQQQIDLLRVHGNISDVRVLVQKDDSGQWKITGKACRVGRTGSITSNISGGGSGHKLPEVLSHYFAQGGVRSILQEIDYLALEAARMLEKDTGSIGELGIDIGIDTHGRIWFIEANLKPARKVFILIGEKSTRQASVMNPMLYSRYLAGFSPERQ